MFFRAADGTFYPLSAVRQFRLGKDGFVQVQIEGQGQVDAFEVTFFDAAEPQFAAIGASPGTYVISAVDDADSDEDLYKVPVIAWSISRVGNPRPITQNGLNDGDPGQRVFVLMPDGSVISTEGHFWKSQAEWSAEEPHLSR